MGKLVTMCGRVGLCGDIIYIYIYIYNILCECDILYYNTMCGRVGLCGCASAWACGRGWAGPFRWAVGRVCVAAGAGLGDGGDVVGELPEEQRQADGPPAPPLPTYIILFILYYIILY